MYLFGGYILVLLTFFPGLFASDQHNAELTSVDGKTKIYVGRNLGILEQIDQRLRNADGSYKEIHVNVPFTTEGLESTVSNLEKQAKWGTQVYLNFHTGRVGRNKDGKRIIKGAANTGLFSRLLGSRKQHEKQVIFVEGTDVTGKSQGTLYFGSGNPGSDTAKKTNEEVELVSTDPEAIIQAKKIQEGYASVMHTYTGDDLPYTPEKGKNDWHTREKKVRSPKPKEFSTVDTDIQGTRENMITQGGVTKVHGEWMTGGPGYFKNLPASVQADIIVDKSAIRPYEAEWKEFLKNHPKARVLVRTDKSGSHHGKLLAREAGQQCLVEVSTANNTVSSSEDLNSSRIVEVKTISPLKRRFDQLSKENNFIEASPTLTKVLSHIPEERPSKKRKISVAPSPTKLTTNVTTTTTTTTTTTKPPRKLSFGE